MAPVLKRWLQAQLAMSGFPFGGFGDTLPERTLTLAIRFVTVRLGLMTTGMPPAPEETLRVVQSLSRFMDHLADPTFSLMAYREAGWEDPARLRALVQDDTE